MAKPLGKLPPRYRFFLNPYPDVRFATCPQCHGRTLLRKVPLLIHVDPLDPVALNKSCRYCSKCDLLIAHQDEVEAQLAALFTHYKPELAGKPYLVMGTLERAAWKRGMREPLSIQEMLDNLHDFKQVLRFEPAFRTEG